MSRSPSTASSSRLRLWLRRLAPWGITIGVVAYLLHEFSLERIVAEVRHGHALPMIPLAFGWTVLSLLIIGTADKIVLQGLLGGPSYKDVLRGKAASSLLDVINYGAGHGAYAVWIGRRAGADALTSAGVMLYIMTSDLTAVCLVTTVSVWIGGAPGGGAEVVRIVAPILAAVLVLLKAIGRLRLLGDRTPRMFHPWTDLTRGRAFAQLGVRCIQISLIVTSTWIASRLFGLSIPFYAMATYLPVILLVGSLPINVAGFGAVQAAWLLLTPWATGPALLALHFLWQLFNMSAIVARGLPFVRRMVAEIDEGHRPPAETPAAAPASNTRA